MRAGLFVLLAGCGFRHGVLGGDAAPADTPADTQEMIDVDAAAVVADAPPDTIGMGPWGNVAVVIAGAGGDDDPTLTADLLELYFNRSADIYVITRTAIGQPWSAPVVVAEVSSVSSETTPEVTSDGLVMFVASDRAGTAGASDIWMSTRASRAAPWGTPVRVPELCSATENAASAPTDDLLAIVQIGNPSGTNVQLYGSTRANTAAAWSSPVAIPGANSASADYSPMLSQDRLTLYFDSNRLDPADEDLFVATRTTATGTFATPAVISELATTGQETDPWISPDGHHLFFVRDNVLHEASR